MGRLFGAIALLFLFSNCNNNEKSGTMENTVLSSVTGYNLLAATTLDLRSSKALGRIGALGDVTLTDYAVGESLPYDAGRCDLSVGGSLVFTRGSVNQGAICAAGTIERNKVGTKSEIRNTVGDDVAALLNQAKSLTKAFADYPPLETISEATLQWERGTISLNGKGRGWNAFTVKPGALKLASRIEITAAPGAGVLINVPGRTIEFRDSAVAVSGIEPQNVVFNFFEADTLVFSSLNLKGAVIAPFARLEFNNGVVEGTSVVRAARGNGRFAHFPFSGNL